ncbi:hypothetical protein NP493_27g01005 [Ridgeia piscesae]|uniref:Uncharacterized protein n=1 Tax=Ridgeia piscesae TaxID=27915 RepID=A0AAD9PDC2_RIDPI|nr:hypothetical protein NP493_27g01005 [Ridgeia piscesae]
MTEDYVLTGEQIADHLDLELFINSGDKLGRHFYGPASPCLDAYLVVKVMKLMIDYRIGPILPRQRSRAEMEGSLLQRKPSAFTHRHRRHLRFHSSSLYRRLVFLLSS